MRIADIMSEHVITIDALDPADYAFDVMKEREIHHLAVTERGRLVGVVSERDLGGPRGSAVRREKRVLDLMSRHVATVTPRTTVREAANKMRNQNIGSLLVANGDKLCGIVTVSDLLDLIGRGATKPTANSVDRARARPAKSWGYPRK
ncbi:MAG: CBS domain-containing protein [Planctomycetes bacterium]|nr:CBS domain-containing protein [Planctomycetota bacterium]